MKFSFFEKKILWLSNLENSEHLKYFRNFYCVVSNHIGDQDTRGNHKLVTFAACSLVISRLIGLFCLKPIIFQKYFQCSQFSEFDNIKEIINYSF